MLAALHGVKAVGNVQMPRRRRIDDINIITLAHPLPTIAIVAKSVQMLWEAKFLFRESSASKFYALVSNFGDSHQCYPWYFRQTQRGPHAARPKTDKSNTHVLESRRSKTLHRPSCAAQRKTVRHAPACKCGSSHPCRTFKEFSSVHISPPFIHLQQNTQPNFFVMILPNVNFFL